MVLSPACGASLHSFRALARWFVTSGYSYHLQPLGYQLALRTRKDTVLSVTVLRGGLCG